MPMMHPIEKAMRAVRTLTQFDVATASVEVVQAAALSAHEQQQVDDSSRHCQSIVQELRGATRRRRLINPAQLKATRRLLLAGREGLEAARARLRSAMRHEQDCRDTLGALRTRESALDRLIEGQRQRARRQGQEVQARLTEDLWLQQSRRSVP
jgi:hypothetical protein